MNKHYLGNLGPKRKIGLVSFLCFPKGKINLTFELPTRTGLWTTQQQSRAEHLHSPYNLSNLHLQILIFNFNMGNRIARIQNETPWLISMKELRMLGASTSLYGYTVQVNPYDSTEIPASLFLNRNHQYGMPSEIVIFTNGAEVRRSLISQDFVRYVKIILSVEGPYLVVRGVLPQVLDICWFW